MDHDDRRVLAAAAHHAYRMRELRGELLLSDPDDPLHGFLLETVERSLAESERLPADLRVIAVLHEHLGTGITLQTAMRETGLDSPGHL
jgi:hypothetical protein